MSFLLGVLDELGQTLELGFIDMGLIVGEMGSEGLLEGTAEEGFQDAAEGRTGRPAGAA